MNKAEALAAIQASFKRGSNTPCSWATDPATYITQKQSELLELVIEPITAKITDETYRYGVKQELASTPDFAIARRASTWLLYAPTTEVFSLAHGDSPENMSILGFSSSDALAEWLG
ncbi:hypothetical protein [Paracidovorax wautersii]|uniref:hypothetical protein n=1 Tax=Paracidovorax wautersii TaxID=1177982 RepID=UPI0011145837|nr:hypothetical protein [Paracidovorax wautersii]